LAQEKVAGLDAEMFAVVEPGTDSEAAAGVFLGIEIAAAEEDAGADGAESAAGADGDKGHRLGAVLEPPEQVLGGGPEVRSTVLVRGHTAVARSVPLGGGRHTV